MYGCLFAALFRFTWYGLIYLHKTFIFIIPLFMLIKLFLDNFENKGIIIKYK